MFGLHFAQPHQREIQLCRRICDADNVKAFSLPDLFLSIDALERKYKRAASEDAWFNVKHDILFQIYLCVLRETVGLPDDCMLPDSLEEFHIPSTVSIAYYRSKVALLMEKYKGYYMQKGQEDDVLHPTFHQQKDALLYRVVHQSDHINDIQVPVLNRDKAPPTPRGFLPAAPHVSAPASSELSAMRVAQVRDQSDIGSGSDILNSDEESLEDDSDDEDEEAAGYNTDQDQLGKRPSLSSAMKAPGEDSQAGGKDDEGFASARTVDAARRSTTELSMVSARKAAEAQGAGIVSTTEVDAAAAAARARSTGQKHSAKISWSALTQPPPAGTDPGFDEYWQGEGWLKDIHYTKSWYYDEDIAPSDAHPFCVARIYVVQMKLECGKLEMYGTIEMF
eukprot:gene16193-18483_t